MTKYVYLPVILFLLINLSCGYNSNITGDQNFTPPSQVNHPRFLYPRVAQEKSKTGNATVLFEITKIGNVINANILKTSGSEELDKSALEYCGNLMFNPAKINGKPTASKMAMEIKFQISNIDMLASAYVMDVNRLYSILRSAPPSDRNYFEREVLEKHIEFVREMKDALNFNAYAAEVLSSNVLAEWEKDWDSWPLSFLLFHDFIQRYPDYDSLLTVKDLLYHALNYDISYINNTANTGTGSSKEKENILSKIRKFAAAHYPDYKFDGTEIENQNNSMPVSFTVEKIIW